MERSKTILLYGREDGLGGGIQKLLSALQDWKLVRVDENEPFDGLVQAIKRANPRVVIVHAGNRFNDTEAPLQLIHRFPKLRVIVVSLESNSVEVYNRQAVNIRSVEDLLSTVED